MKTKKKAHRIAHNAFLLFVFVIFALRVFVLFVFFFCFDSFHLSHSLVSRTHNNANNFSFTRHRTHTIVYVRMITHIHTRTHKQTTFWMSEKTFCARFNFCALDFLFGRSSLVKSRTVRKKHAHIIFCHSFTSMPFKLCVYSIHCIGVCVYVSKAILFIVALA